MSEASEKGPAEQPTAAITPILCVYVACVIIFGTVARVMFKILQFSMINYTFTLYLAISLLSIPLCFIVLFFKLQAGHISPKNVAYQKWKFGIIGILDGLANLIFVVAGAPLDGFLQVLLLQCCLPVTMFFSLLLLRYRGNSVCRTARAILDKNGINYTETFFGEEKIAQANGEPLCQLWINGRSVGDIPKRLKHAKPPDHDLISRCLKYIYRCFLPKGKLPSKELLDESASSGAYYASRGEVTGLDSKLATLALFNEIDPTELSGEVILITDAHSWKQHLATFYTLPQYVGALMIMVGLIIVITSQKVNDQHNPSLWLGIFICGTIPASLSIVYQDIAACTEKDVDVCYATAFSLVPQFIFSFFYAPLAMVMAGIQINHFPSNLWDGVLCAFGINEVSLDRGYECSTYQLCFVQGSYNCCDSCDGSIPSIASVHASLALVVYVVTHLLFTTFASLTAQHGPKSSKFIGISLTVPLASIAFKLPWMKNTGLPLLTIFGKGLFIYGLVDYIMRKKKREQLKRATEHPYFGSGYFTESFTLYD